MRLRSFYGPTMTEAMRVVREALGEDAIIVAARDDESGGVRVTAAVEEKTEAAPSFASSAGQASAASRDDGFESIETIASALLAHNVPTALAERLLATATQFASEDPLLAFGAALDTHFTFCALLDDRPAAPLMFIGPPGAGKTLCTAKYATKATLEKRPLAVIGTDTECAGGMAQLAAFSRLLKTDLMETDDPHALKDAVSIQPPGTVTLIDTAGCNPFAEDERQRLSALIKASGATPVLVLPADQDSGAAVEMAQAFAEIGAQRLLFTRLDMTRRAGSLLRVAAETRLPLAAFSASAKVTTPPQNLNPVSLARMILPAQAETESRPSEGKRA